MNNEIQTIYEHWMSYKDLPRHDINSKSVTVAIEKALEKYTLDDILDGISHYAENLERYSVSRTVTSNGYKYNAASIYSLLPKRIAEYMKNGKKRVEYEECQQNNSPKLERQYRNAINKTIAEIWRIQKYKSHLLDDMENRTQLWFYFYNCLNKYEGINSYEIRQRKGSGSILSKMTLEELKQTYWYAQKFKSDIKKIYKGTKKDV